MNHEHHNWTRPITLVAMGLWGLLLVLNPQQLLAQNRHDRDHRIRDYAWPREEFHTRKGRSRDRSSTEMLRFRTIDGTQNNPVGVFWGAAGANLRRRVPSAYADGVSAPAGASRKPARSISNYLCNQNGQDMPNDRGLSSMVWQWGQFLDHDITLTEIDEPAESFPILIPMGDRYFDPFGIGGLTMGFDRSHFNHAMPASMPREQINSITSWIDASNVYGSDDETAMLLRSHVGGRLATSEGDLPPLDDGGFFLAGDVRANEQVGLTVMHTIFLREHNRQANLIAERYPWLTDEQIYVRARRQVSALMQRITYDEFLPALLGEDAISPYRGYNPLVFPNVSNLFSTAAYRFGHSMIPTELLRLDARGNEIAAGHLSLTDAFFNPANLVQHGVEPYLRGLAAQQAQEVDTKVVGDLRSFLFGPPGAGGFDLPALNIQRGRDHGLADFNTVREFYGLPRYNSFAEVSSDPQVQASLELAYHSIDDLDPWIGFLAEDHLAGASVGPTAMRVLTQQFEMLRDGDRFWYERDLMWWELDEVECTTLADVIERNSGVRNLPRNLFFVR